MFFLTTTCLISAIGTRQVGYKSWKATINDENGTLSNYKFLSAGKWGNIPFREDGKGGFSFEGIKMHQASKENTYTGEKDNIIYTIEYKPLSDHLLVICKVTNNSSANFSPNRVRLTVGIDSEMHKYPTWDEKYFPTLMRCEQSFAWGYFMSPKGMIAGIASEEPVASYGLNYIDEGNKEWTWGHQIKTASFDLIHCLPLPSRHPQYLTTLKKGESMTWHIHFGAVNSFDNLKNSISKWADCPLIELSHYTVAPGDEIDAQIFSKSKIKNVCITNPEGSQVKNFNNDFSQKGDASKLKGLGKYIESLSEVGIYQLDVTDMNGKRSTATFYLRHPWSWYIKQARNSVVASPPYMGFSCETFYGYYPAFIASQVFPDNAKDEMLRKRFERDAVLMIDTLTGIPREVAMPKRIQNFASMIGMYIEMWKATKNESYIRIASRIGDYLCSPSIQWSDGSYRSGKVDYTAVIYPVKSMIELSLAEKQMPGEKWQTCYKRHWKSANSAAAYLQRSLDNIETEGDMTFEDGMISCSALQLGMMGVNADNAQVRSKMTKAAAYMLDKHRCVEQLQIPDCRMRGATLRFWEALDLYFSPNQVMNSPHGWSAWKIYAEYYLYQLTGNEKYLTDMMNSLGTGAQLMRKDGHLRWGFMPDPYVDALVCVPQKNNPHDWQKCDSIVGEQYMEMISPWLRPDKDDVLCNFGARGGAGDNTVYEIFRAIGQCSVTSAYVVLRENGSLAAYNCKAVMDGGKVVVTPSEDCIDKVSMNFKKDCGYIIKYKNGSVSAKHFKGINWIEKKKDVAAHVPQFGKDSIKDIVNAMTTDEKAEILVGGQWALDNGSLSPRISGVAGTTLTFSKYGIPTTVMTDGPAGVRIPSTRAGEKRTYFCTAYPIGTMLASTWNEKLVHEVGQSMGNEVLEYGCDVLLAPGMNIHRNPLNGRNFEYYSEDPVLSGKIAASMVRGLQSEGVGASIKHFAANSQQGMRLTNDARISQRALREIYLKGFEIAVKESQPWTVMSSYNKINGCYTQESYPLLTTLLRDEWGYKGLVITDWTGQRNTLAQVHAGNDLMMAGTRGQVDEIINGIKSGQLKMDDVDRNVTRVLEYIAKTPSAHKYKYSNNPDLKSHASMARTSADEGMVLLKNENNALPLNKDIHNIAMFGIGSYYFYSGGLGSGDVNKAYMVNLDEGLKNAGYNLLPKLDTLYQKHITCQKAMLDEVNRSRDWFFGMIRPDELEIDTTYIAFQSKEADAAVISFSRTAGEVADRFDKEGDFRLSEKERQLLDNVSRVFHAAGKKVIVILNTGGVMETASWKNIPDAILMSWQAGQEAGNSVADILCGKVNPSGKLPMTFPVTYSDTPSAKDFPSDYVFSGWSDFDNPKLKTMKNLGYTDYNEDIWIGYRYFSTYNKTVSYPFGYGLSYTTFAYDKPKMKVSNGKIEVSLRVRNTGKCAGKEVVELYVAAPKGKLIKPAEELKAFAKTSLLNAGEEEVVKLSFSIDDLASFDQDAMCWITDKGNYKILIGSSCEDIRLTLPLQIKNTLSKGVKARI